MNNSELTKVFSLIPSIFFLFVACYYIASIFFFFINKSLGKITNGKEAILKSWFFFLFCFTYGYTMVMIYSFEQITIVGVTIESFYSKGLGFILGLICMTLAYVVPIKVNKKKLQNKTTLTDSPLHSIGEVNNAVVASSTSLTNEINNLEIAKAVKVNQDIQVNIQNSQNNSPEELVVDEICDIQELIQGQNETKSYDDNKIIDKADDINQLKKASRSSQGHITSRVWYKNSKVVPDNINDDIVEQKLNLIKDLNEAFCNYEDFKNMLYDNELTNKILFKNKDGVNIIFASKLQYLQMLNLIVDDNLIHLKSPKIREWINQNFDDQNIEGKEILPKDISELRTNYREQLQNNKSNLR